MRSRNLVIASVVAALFVTALLGTVAYGIYAGMNEGAQRAHAAATGKIVIGAVPAALNSTADSARASGPANTSSSAAIAQPAPGFLPGAPYGESGVSADGISAWGVAYREVADATAQPDAALVRAAYQDAEKKVNDLASATGIKAGKLISISDHAANQPYFKPCIEVQPPPGKPVPGAATGSGSSGSGIATQVAPAPCAANNNNYLVVWVYVRHAIG